MEAIFVVELVLGVVVIVLLICSRIFSADKKNRDSNAERGENRERRYARKLEQARKDYAAEQIGMRGEGYVSYLLSRDPAAIVINDIILYDWWNGKSAQIDHIVVRSNGVFVIETKNLAGTVYGNDELREWTQALADGKKRYQFYNPVWQNDAHINFLAKVLHREGIYFSVVIFPRAELKIVSKGFVCNNSEAFYSAMTAQTGVFLSAGQMQKIAEQLYKIKANPRITKEEHVRKVREIQERAANSCPKCGRKLKLCHGKHGDFYGCSGYPQCRFIKKD